MILDVIIGDEETSPPMHEIVVGSRIRRILSNMPNVIQIIDLDDAKMLALDTEETWGVLEVTSQSQDHTRTRVRTVLLSVLHPHNLSEIAAHI